MGRANSCRRLLAAVLAAGVWGLTTAATAAASTYYVSASGNDGGLGTQASPWKTLQKAAGVAGAGDDVVVTPGTYAGFRPMKSGTAQAPVRFLAQTGVVVNAPGPLNSNADNIWVRDVHYVVIDGFESTAAPRAGIAVQGEPDANATGIVIRHCFCHHNSRWGIFTGFARDLLIENNETSYAAIEHGIYVSNSGDRPTVRANHVHHNNASGIQLNADPAEMGADPTDPQGDGIITDALIEQNLIHDNGAAGGAAINLASVRTSLIRNNLLYANLATGIAGWDDGDGNAFGTQGNRIIGNTIVQPSTGRFAIGLKDGSIDNAVFDNVLLHLGTRGALEVDPSSRPGLQSDDNVVTAVFSDDTNFLTLTQWRALGFDQHSMVATASAVFVDQPGGDFHLSATSPARDIGIALPDLPTDLDGTSRPQGSAFDAGAYELVVSGASPTPTRTSLPTASATARPSATRTASATATRTPSATPTRTGTATATRTATATATGGFHISGTVRAYRGGLPVASATVRVDGGSTGSTASSATGAYTLSGVPGGTRQVSAQKLGDRNGGISALDAAYVLQYVSGQRTLDTGQQLACDVTANGSLSALDATRILQYTVGLLPQFAAADACGSDWLFAPAAGTPGGVAPTFENGVCHPGHVDLLLDADRADVSFDALLIGDCTGNWQPAGPPAQRAMAAPAAAIRVRRIGTRVRIAVSMRAAVPFSAAEATLAVSGRVSVRAARPLLAARGGLVAAHAIRPGQIAVAFAAAAPVRSGTRAALVLDVDAAPDSDVALSRLAVE
jgi:hypothetical protein